MMRPLNEYLFNYPARVQNTNHHIVIPQFHKHRTHSLSFEYESGGIEVPPVPKQVITVFMAQATTTWNNQSVDVCVKSYATWVQNFITIDGYFIFYYVFRLIFVHMLPCIALVTLNLLLFRALKQAQKRRDILLSSKKNQKNECKKLRDSNCTTLMLIVVVSVFLLVEIPLAVVTMLHIISSSIIEFLDYEVANTLIIFTNFFIILSYPINFAIYCGMSRQFRETFKELFISGAGNARNGSSRYSVVNGPRTCTNETVL
ncbi:hypothetical protein GWI33_005343 [Rhynchophorus ferrugineus]|uniref:G-protein coupled receptors family 1 profile domain-containing protein n=1 Tax=Rhynchophorus ferrugineus TaxID=354439 RepID=A0A834MMT4_RHYFE|nr:hypothetical protein GWI33_005343 [Rhynchophorus ferrugineus]